MSDMSGQELRTKYGDASFEAGFKLRPQSFAQDMACFDDLDQNFARLWLDFAILGAGRREVLDLRTRTLVQIGQFTMTKCHRELEDTIRAALAAGVKPREILEIIMQCTVYGGITAARPAIEVFHRIAKALGLLEALRASQLPLDGNDRKRSYDKEFKTWHPDDIADPRFADFMKRHGWLAVGRGLTVRPRHHLDALGWQDAMDPAWANLWVRFCYQGMYSRGIVDERTRHLCMVGNCIAVGEVTQLRGHMRGALRIGVPPREVLEVIFQSSVHFGMPLMIRALQTFTQVMDENGRLAEIGNPIKRAG